jgi:predicted O-methyltransferase YrrM
MRLLDRSRHVRRELRFLVALRRLPGAVAVFQWRAHRLARKIGDEFSLASATRPEKLELILALARGRQRVAELGTATGWTAISLLLADSQRTVVTFDPIERPTRRLYLDLARGGVRERLSLNGVPGAEVRPDVQPVDFLYIDSSHDREETIAELEAWRPHLEPNATVVLDDFDHPEYPGVRDAVRQLELKGEQRQGLFIARDVGHASPRPTAQPSAQP